MRQPASTSKIIKPYGSCSQTAVVTHLPGVKRILMVYKMKYVFLFFLLIQPVLSYCQFFVGDSKETVKSVLKSNNIKFTESELTDTTSRISVLYENAYQMIWVLDSNNTVVRQTLIPEGENGINEFVKWFNEDLVIVSHTEWLNYANGRIYKIQLEYILREPFFSITISPDSK